MESVLLTLDRLAGRLARLTEGALFLLVATFSLLAFVQVVLRYGFNRGLFWADELTLFAFTWAIFLSAALALERRLHFGVFLLVDRLPGRLRHGAGLLAEAGMAGVVLFFLWFGVWHAWTNWIQVSDVLRMPMTWWYASLPVACLLMLLSLARDICLLLTGRDVPRAQEDVV
ncbi:MAG: TRAP transporter small permease [Candidatus Methylomirabilales bacterium]